jgi:leucine-rich repeat transmembrane neuronal protein 1/2
MGAKFTKHKNSPFTQRNLNAFDGEMQQLIINGRSYFELIANDDLPAGTVNKTATFTRLDLPHKYPLSFATTHSSLELPKIDAHHILLIQFHFKTAEDSGLILYNRGRNSDFLAVELHAGQVSYVFSMGSEINRIRSRSRAKLNDNKWHLVSIWRSTRTNHELTVDSLVYKYATVNSEHVAFNLVDRLYLGGVRNQSMYGELVRQNRVVSRHGFKGCIASLEINGHVPDFDSALNNRNKVSGNISKGCESKFLFYFTHFDL